MSRNEKHCASPGGNNGVPALFISRISQQHPNSHTTHTLDTNTARQPQVDAPANV
jgi:hypothetical protein